jgi:hypothetical protein
MTRNSVWFGSPEESHQRVELPPVKSAFNFKQTSLAVDTARVRAAYSRASFGFVGSGIIALALAAVLMLAALAVRSAAIATVSLGLLFLSTILIGEAQRRAKIERGSRT